MQCHSDADFGQKVVQGRGVGHRVAMKADSHGVARYGRIRVRVTVQSIQLLKRLAQVVADSHSLVLVKLLHPVATPVPHSMTAQTIADFQTHSVRSLGSRGIGEVWRTPVGNLI